MPPKKHILERDEEPRKVPRLDRDESCTESETPDEAILHKTEARKALVCARFLEDCRKGDAGAIARWFRDPLFDREVLNTLAGAALRETCRSGNADAVDLILFNPNFNIGYINVLSGDVLNEACRSGNVTLIHKIFTHPLFKRDNLHSLFGTPLFEACASGSLDAVKYVLQSILPARPFLNRENGLALQKACRSGNPELIRFILGHPDFDGSLVNADDGKPFLEACRSGSFGAVLEVRNHPAFRPELVREGALSAAIEGGNPAIIDFLYRNLGFTTNNEHYKDLILACHTNNPEVFDKVLKNSSGFVLNDFVHDLFHPHHLIGFEFSQTPETIKYLIKLPGFWECDPNDILKVLVLSGDVTLLKNWLDVQNPSLRLTEEVAVKALALACHIGCDVPLIDYMVNHPRIGQIIPPEGKSTALSYVLSGRNIDAIEYATAYTKLDDSDEIDDLLGDSGGACIRLDTLVQGSNHVPSFAYFMEHPDFDSPNMRDLTNGNNSKFPALVLELRSFSDPDALNDPTLEEDVRRFDKSTGTHIGNFIELESNFFHSFLSFYSDNPVHAVSFLRNTHFNRKLVNANNGVALYYACMEKNIMAISSIADCPELKDFAPLEEYKDDPRLIEFALTSRQFVCLSRILHLRARSMPNDIFGEPFPICPTLTGALSRQYNPNPVMLSIIHSLPLLSVEQLGALKEQLKDIPGGDILIGLAARRICCTEPEGPPEARLARSLDATSGALAILDGIPHRGAECELLRGDICLLHCADRLSLITSHALADIESGTPQIVVSTKRLDAFVKLAEFAHKQKVYAEFCDRAFGGIVFLFDELTSFPHPRAEEIRKLLEPSESTGVRRWQERIYDDPEFLRKVSDIWAGRIVERPRSPGAGKDK